MRIGGSLFLVAALTLAGCDLLRSGDNGSQDEVAYVTPAGALMPAGVERYICPDRTLDGPDAKRAVARVSKELRDSGVNPNSRFMEAMQPDPLLPGILRILVGGKCDEPIPELHGYSIYSVDLAADAVSIWRPS